MIKKGIKMHLMNRDIAQMLPMQVKASCDQWLIKCFSGATLIGFVSLTFSWLPRLHR